MALNALGVPALAVCSNTVTAEQAVKLAALARELGGNTVSVMFDLDREGENGAKQAVVELASHCPVRFAWHAGLADGKFRGRQPESVTQTEWNEHFKRLIGNRNEETIEAERMASLAWDATDHV